MSATQSAPALIARGASASLTEQLAGRFAERIQRRLLAPGARLPSVRDCAQRHGVSPSTVVGAYDLLQARGLVHARPQRGFFVREPTSPVARQSPPLPRTARPAPVDATALIRSMFQAQGGLPAPGMGTLPETWLDADVLQRALRKVCQQPQAWLRYGDPAGNGPLRQALVHRLADLGVPATAAQIVTPWAPRRRWTSSAARCCNRATRCWWTNPAGPSNTPASRVPACACCRCRAANTAPTWL